MVCSDCKDDLPIHANGLCRKCYTKEWRNLNPDKATKSRAKSYLSHAEERREYASRMRVADGRKPFYENKTCSQYLGVHIAERVLCHVFNDVEKMPFNFPGYDFICNKGKKIDVKSSCLHKERGIIRNWSFCIRKNKVADYFLCLAFDNRNDLTPVYIWLIPDFVINTKTKISISPSTLSKWDEYKLDINDVVSCCNEIKK